jgi:glycine cleavage system H lipoate-binding protein
MFSLRLGTKKVFQNNIILRRNLSWMENNNGIITVGITQKTVKEFGKINYIYISSNNIIKMNDKLFDIESDKMINNVHTPFDCMIIERNNNNLHFINISPENTYLSWVIKIMPIQATSFESYYQYDNKNNYFGFG